MVSDPKVLLLWPGSLPGGGANFGVPQLLMMAQALRRQTHAQVDVVDLDMERALGPVDLGAIAAKQYDLVGIACYSSFDYLKVMAIAARLRSSLPRAWFVVGGYHPSARPADFTVPESPFDFVVVGDGERPLVRLMDAMIRGRRPLQKILGPEATPNPSEVMPYDFTLLERYRPIARRVASQAELYLSRGCPYDCAFCMERAKRDTSWRSLEPLEAVEQLHRLDDFLDLNSWTVFIADALFGMKRGWRREFLEALVRQPTRAVRTWLLIRVDLIEREDMALMARANVSPGFGLESGDEAQLRRIRKSGKLDGYLDKMALITEWARQFDVPFGANIIVGHPGETEASLRQSAATMRRLFVNHPRGTHGFLSVDPFRLYPGSPIDEEREQWETETGMKLHRFPWWHDADQDFLSEWVDPSSSLNFRTTARLQAELFDPIVQQIEREFAYNGSARQYFMKAIRSQVALTEPKHRLRRIGLHHLWTGLCGGNSQTARSRRVSEDSELADVARAARNVTLGKLRPSAHLASALLEVPRERFVRLEDITSSADDLPLYLSADGSATISAMHAYLKNFELLDLVPGDTVIELGGGTGYGSALARQLVGPAGRVVCVEIDEELAAQARKNLSDFSEISVMACDAHDVARWLPAIATATPRLKVCVGFALDTIPRAWTEMLGFGGCLVAPVRQGRTQVLTRFEGTVNGLLTTEHGPVRYVDDRGTARGIQQAPSERALQPST